jgi:hypothetical protein
MHGLYLHFPKRLPVAVLSKHQKEPDDHNSQGSVTVATRSEMKVLAERLLEPWVWTLLKAIVLAFIFLCRVVLLLITSEVGRITSAHYPESIATGKQEKEEWK